MKLRAEAVVSSFSTLGYTAHNTHSVFLFNFFFWGFVRQKNKKGEGVVYMCVGHVVYTYIRRFWCSRHIMTASSNLGS